MILHARHSRLQAVSYYHMDSAPLTVKKNDPASVIRHDIAGFAAIGALSMAYLIYVHFKPSGSAFCDFGPGFSCEIVNKSVYADLYGVPVSVLGLAYFLGILALSTRERFERYFGEIQAMTIASLVFGLYLSWVEVALLGSICAFCELSKLMMVAIAVCTVTAAKKAGIHPVAKWTPLAFAAGLLGVVAARYVWSAFV